jgi:hypothetical protein
MSRDKISEWSTTPADNTDIGGINIAEGMPPANVNNAIRMAMSQIKDQQAGSDGDNFVVGGNLSVTGTTTLGGVPTGPTASAGTNTTQLATTAFVNTKVGTVGTMAAQSSGAVNITGGAITGTTINSITVGSNGSGTKTVSSGNPSGGVDGDIWYRIT